VKGKKLPLQKDVLEVGNIVTKHELEMCISEYGKDIYAFCKHLTNNTLEADDLYQDTFLKAVELNHEIDYGNNPKSYLLSIALRIWRNKKRKFAWRKRIADVQVIVDERDTDMYVSNEVSLEEQMIHEECYELVREAVKRLPDKLKIVTLLFYMEGLSTTQIAEMMKIPTGTVLSRLYQARKILKRELEDVLDGK